MENCKYTQEVRDLVCRFAVLGAKYRKIPVMVREVLAYRFPQQEFHVPSKSSVDRIVREGGLKSKLQSLKILHEMTSPILGQDLSTSRGRTLLALSALGDDNGVVLSTTEIVNHSAQSQVNQIEKIIDELKTLCSQFPETSTFISSLSISSFIGTMSDHTNVNGAIMKCLNQTHGTNLLDLKCHPHKSDLIETAFHNTLKRERALCRSVNDGEVEIVEKGMKVPKGKRSFDASEHFLYTVTQTLSPTGTQKYGFASNFTSWTLLKDKKLKLIPIKGSRFHIYSLNALSIYPHLSLISDFVTTSLNPDTWTATYLRHAIDSPQTKQELRLLGLFSYMFAHPMLTTFELYTIDLASKLWKVVKEMFEQLKIEQVSATLPESFDKLWEFVIANEIDENRKTALQKMKVKEREKLNAILIDWTNSDLLLWVKALESSEIEISKIAKEYLSEGNLTIVPSNLQHKPGHNLMLESHFSIWKGRDTYANHYSVNSLESQVQLLQNATTSKIVFSEETEKKIRKIVKYAPTQQEKDKVIAEEKKRKWEDEKHEREQKKRKKNLQAKMQAKEFERVIYLDMEVLPAMTKAQIQSQLRLWNKYDQSVSISGTRGECEARLASLITRECMRKQANKNKTLFFRRRTKICGTAYKLGCPTDVSVRL